MVRRISTFRSFGYSLLCALFACCFSLTNLSAQTYVNKEWVRSSGSPDNLQWSASAVYPDQSVVVVGNTQVAPGNSDVLITKYDRYGIQLWQHTFDGSAEAQDYGVAVSLDANGSVYVAAATKSTGELLDITVLKYGSGGNAVWNTTWSGADNLDDVPTCMVLDPNGPIYIGGVSKSATTQEDYVVLKLNGSGVVQWAGEYDYASLPDGVTGIELDNNGDPVASGGSAAALNSWDYAAVTFSVTNGSVLGVKRVDIPGLGLDKPLAVVKDSQGNFIITGFSEANGDKDIQTVKLDSDLEEVLWVANFDGDGEDDAGVSVDVDGDDNVFITGYTVKQAGGSDFITIKYDPAGSEEWQVRHRAPGNGQEAKASKVVVTADGHVLVTGSENDNGDVNFRTFMYRNDGRLMWTKAYDGYGAEDRALDVVADGSENLYVVGVVMGPNGPEFHTLRYSYFTADHGDVYDEQDVPVCKDRELIVRFDPSMVDPDFVDDTDVSYARLSSVIDADLFDDLESKTESNLADATVIKIYQSMTTANVSSTSRLGRTVQMPPMWAGLRVILPAGTQLPFILEQINDRTGPDPLFPRIRYAEPNWAVSLSAVVPNDPQYEDQQLCLHENGSFPQYENADINAEGAWTLGAKGDPSINVGVFDTGIQYNHEDFRQNNQTGSTGSLVDTKVKGGKDYTIPDHTPIEDLADPDIGGHGTNVAGIIAAKRNNEKGVAGVAGGDDFDDNNEGTSLYAMKCFPNNEEFTYVAVLYDALFEGMTIAPGDTPLDIYNCSWAIYPAVSLYNSYTINELKEVIRLAFNHEILMVFSRGNGGLDQPSYPATYYPFYVLGGEVGDDWVMSIGASGTDGEWKQGNTNGSPNYTPNFGRQLDVIAPGVTELVQTTHESAGYSSFFGTSSAAAYVSGLAAALMAYHPTPLAPEDVEHLIQFGAADRNVADYDWETGSGLIDCGASTELIAFPEYRVVHYDVEPTVGVSVVEETMLENMYADYDVFGAGPYWVNVVKYEATVQHVGLGPDAEFVWTGQSGELPYWIRNSASNLWGRMGGSWTSIDNVLVPESSCSFAVSPTITSATVVGYHYELLFIEPEPIIVPYSAQPGGEPNRIAYSLLVHDPAFVGIEEDELGMQAEVYPNPTGDAASLRYELNDRTTVSIDLLDARGRLVQRNNLGERPAGEYVFQFNLSHFADGLYVIQLKTDQGHAHRKLLKGQ